MYTYMHFEDLSLYILHILGCRAEYKFEKKNKLMDENIYASI